MLHTSLFGLIEMDQYGFRRCGPTAGTLRPGFPLPPAGAFTPHDPPARTIRRALEKARAKEQDDPVQALAAVEAGRIGRPDLRASVLCDISATSAHGFFPRWNFRIAEEFP